jgi:hypothetical protein
VNGLNENTVTENMVTQSPMFRLGKKGKKGTRKKGTA